MSKFIIFASARTGSTSLARVLGESKDVKMSIEPFHPNYFKWNPRERNYSEYIKNSETMSTALDEIFETYTAIKVLNYQFDEEIYKTMLRRSDFKIVFLKRESLFDQILSDLIAHQTQEWHKSNKLDLYYQLKPINPDEMQSAIDYVKEMNQTYFDFLKRNRTGEFLPLTYEGLYSEDMDKNKKTIQSICDFLHVSFPPIEAIEKHMKPSEAKININSLYSNLPNIQELKERFGKL